MNKCPICGQEKASYPSLPICGCNPLPVDNGNAELEAKNAAEVAKRNAAILEAFMNGKTVEEF